MFGKNIVGGGTGLTLSKALGGISKALNVANQAIPIYEQVKPMVQNAKSTLGIVKTIFSTDRKKDVTAKEEINVKKTQNDANYKTSNAPVFFQ